MSDWRPAPDEPGLRANSESWAPAAMGAQPFPPGAYSEPLAVSPRRRSGAHDDVRGDVKIAAVIAAGLAVLGALLGLVWAAWSPTGPRALVLSPGVLEPDETEAFAAGDGRFLVISAVVGVLAALLAWRLTRHRGPGVLLALAVGGLLGSLLMELVGHLAGGGTFAGRPNTLIDALPLSLHMQGLLFVQAGLAVLVYGMIVAFAVHDDLGRADPVRHGLASAAACTEAERPSPAMPLDATPPDRP